MNPALLSRFALLLCCLGLAGRLHAQGTAFTYQGSLADDGGPATGTYDFQFTVFDAASGGAAVGAVASLPGQPVADGLFTVTVDPGAAVFTGPARWLEIAVRTNGAASFSTLAVRQPLAPAPYAIHAATAGSAATATLATTATTANSVAATGVTGTLTAGQLPAHVAYRTGGNAFTGDQTVMSGKVGIGTTSPGAALQVSGNFISGGANTVDPATVEAAILGGTGNVIQSNGGRAIIGGGSANTIESGSGSSIIGSGFNNAIRSGAPYSVVGGGYGNEISSGSRNFIGGGFANSLWTNSYSAVVGGYNNKIYSGANYASIGGGVSSAIGEGAYQAAVGGGAGNVVEPGAYMSVIAGGRDNLVRTNAVKAAIGGGQLNRAGGQYATVPGGQFNDAEGNFSFAAGRRAKAPLAGDFVWADSQNADFSATGTDQFLIRAQGGVGIGTTSPVAQLDVTGAIRSQGRVVTHAQGAYLEWNKDGESGQTWLINHKGLGDGGIVFGEVDSGDTVTEGMQLSGQDLKVKGNVKMGTSPEVYAMGAMAGSRLIAGNIFSSGPTINRGTGFSVAKLGTGSYQITYANPGSYSIVTATPVNGGMTISTTSAGGSSVIINMQLASTGAAADSDFSFMAVVGN